MGKSFPRFERGLRLELNDMIHAAETAVLETVGQLIDEFIIGYDHSGGMQRNYIVRGFTVTNPSGSLLTIQNGVALLQYKHRGEMKAAVHLSGGDSNKTVDVGALTDGSYFVYVRWDLQDTDYQNRLALDPLASPAPAERVRHVPTRRTETWSATFGLASPGDEWEPVASFDITAGVISNLTDVRNLYFEGEPSGGAYPLVPTTDWGTTDDRDNARGTYGVQGLRKFVRAIQQQLETLQGDGKKWWQTPTTTMNNKLNRDGTNTIIGDIDPDAANTRSLGLNSRFATIVSSLFRGNTVAPYSGSTLTLANANIVDISNSSSRLHVGATDGYVRLGAASPSLSIGTHENCLIGPLVPKAAARVVVSAFGGPPTYTAYADGCTVSTQSLTYNNAAKYAMVVDITIPMSGASYVYPVVASFRKLTSGGANTSDLYVHAAVLSSTQVAVYLVNDGSHQGWDSPAPDSNLTGTEFGLVILGRQ